MAAKKKPPTYEYYNFDELCTYAGIDNVATSELLARLWVPLNAKPHFRDYDAGTIKDIMAPSIIDELINVKQLALEFTCNLKITGMYYNQERNTLMAARMKEDLVDCEERIYAAAGKTFHLKGQELYNFLYREKRYVCTVKTKGGDDATSGDALKEMIKNYPEDADLLRDIKRWQDVTAMYNNFIVSYIHDFVKPDSRIHASYNLQGTSSHRINSTDPNMLNMPRGYYGYNIRDLYTATPGYTLMAFDFSSCEVKILAALSGDPNMIYACEQGYDFHSFSASLMMGIEYEEFLANKKVPSYSDMRQFAKAVTFGILYGSSVGGIAATLGITKEKAQEIINSYFDKFPKVRDFINDCHARAKANFFVFSPFGQRKQEHGARYIFKGSSVHNAALRNAQNVSIQGPASTFGLICFANLDRALRERGIGRAVLTVYDSVEFEILRGHEAEANELAFYYLDDWPVEHFDWLNFKVGCDGEIGPTFGSLSETKRGMTQEEIEVKLAKAEAFMDETWDAVADSWEAIQALDDLRNED